MSTLLSDKILRRLAVLGLVLAGICVIWSAGISSSLWLDETITAWIANAPLAIVTERVLAFQGQSPLYFWLVALIIKSIGFSELIIRLPSIIAGVISLVALYHLSRGWFSSQASYFALALMLSHVEFLRAIFSARPYIFSLLFLIVSIWYLNRLEERNRGEKLLFAGASFLIAFYFHYLIALSFLPVFALFLMVRLGHARGLNLTSLALLLSGALLAIPGIAQMMALRQRIEIYSFAPPISFVPILKSIVPLESVIFAGITVVLLFIFLSKESRTIRKGQTPLLMISVAIVLIPILTLVTLSVATGESFLLGRYAIGTTIGVALVGAWMIDRFVASHSRWWAVVIILLVITINPREWHHEDWRSSLRNAELESPGDNKVIFLYSGLAESESFEWLMNQTNHEYLTTPVQLYATGQKVIPLPRSLAETKSELYIREIVAPVLNGKDTISLIALRSSKEIQQQKESQIVKQYEPLLSQLGFIRSAGNEKSSGTITHVSFKRAGPNRA